MKSLEDRLSRAVEGGDSIAIDLAKGDLERKASERYKGFVVRNRLKSVLNEAVKCSAFMHKEELRRFPCRYIKCVNAPDRRVLRLNREIHEAFWTHFQDRFAHCSDLQAQEFCNYLVDFPGLGEVEAASCEGALKCIVVHWSRSALTSRLDWMVYPTKCTWGCRTCLPLFWRMCSTIGLPREPSLVALPRVW